ncbi:MAG: alpha-glucan family phosphorylase [Alphaproteobacteria bacterium]|nr:alpha-glucan family phosphorylase [Alphaproteobacteria bacterium]MDE2072471.1 alpha-glucan family phosphorylase [Alphaproteobacteria bacterium]
MVALPLPSLPDEIAALQNLALDLRWTWSHEGDALWEHVDARLWDRTHSPWAVLQSTPSERFKALAADNEFRRKLGDFAAARARYQEQPGWFRKTYGPEALGGVAYFSMEFGLGAALPLYAGGLGVLAGDFLKTASDLDVPVIGIGLLYQEGYFRQIVDSEGVQQELYPYNEPATMPIEPVIVDGKGWLRVVLQLPGRDVTLRVWQATVGRVKLYLLDSNDPLNSPVDRGITAKLYGGGSEVRLIQEIALGVGGWRVIEALRPEIEICHINEGHAAFAIIERARDFAHQRDVPFWDAFWACRAGNIFTTHTPVAAGFDVFHPALLRKYLPYVEGELSLRGVTLDDILCLGRIDPHDRGEPFNMAYLGLRGSGRSIGVSRLHGEFSRGIFQSLFPRWPHCEVPVGHITNGVHIPTWDSAEADEVWTCACGKERWRTLPDPIHQNIAGVSDEALWAMRGNSRQHLVAIARRHLATQLRERGFEAEAIRRADHVLDPNVLMLGFARRFTEYKRPNLLLSDPARLERLLLDPRRPAQIVVAGKAHPADVTGKTMIREWINFARDPRYRDHIVFLEDYDIALAQDLVQGVDVWINTPRRPWEACGTSGMKVLVNGGLNVSVLDGWWDEAYRPELGWPIGDDQGGAPQEVDARDADSLYSVLENAVIPEFYDRDAEGLPRRWLGRIRRSMAGLTPAFSSTRMLRQYVEDTYLPLAAALRTRIASGCAAAKDIRAWADLLTRHWPSLHIGDSTVSNSEGVRRFSVPVFLGDVPAASVRVELFADARDGDPAQIVTLHREREIPGSANGFIYAGEVKTTRPAADYTVRAVPDHQGAFLPSELPLIVWQR